MFTFRSRIKRALRIRNLYAREFLAEFLAVFVLITFGCGSLAQSVLSHHKAGEYLTTNIAWGLAVAMATWTSLRVSGAHLNPAITLAMWILGHRNLKQVAVYWLAQYLAAFVASAAVYGVYYDALNNYDGGNRAVVGENATAGIWSSYPQPYQSTLSLIGDQVFTSALLLLSCAGIVDKYNMAPEFGMIPLFFGAVVALIGMTYSMNSGSSMNPARDFSPRLFTAVAGWGTEVFTVYDYYFWIPLVIPHIGTVCGAWMYMVFVGIHLQPKELFEAEKLKHSLKNKSETEHQNLPPIHTIDVVLENQDNSYH